MNQPVPGRAVPFITMEDVVLHHPGNEACPPIRWQIWGDQHWAIVGPNGSGKSALARALSGRAPVAGGRIVYNLSRHNGSGRGSQPHERIAYVDFEAQRAFVGRESPFYQARWNSVGSEDVPSVADYLSERGVRGFNPYKMVEVQPDPATYLADRARIVALLGIDRLLERRIVEISSGERRKVLLARALLQDPELLILDNPFAGLDQDFRLRLRGIVQDLMQDKIRVMVVVATWEDIPPGITHVLAMRGGQVVSKGLRPKRAIPDKMPQQAVILTEAQRSEESQVGEREILRCAQDDGMGEGKIRRRTQDGGMGEGEILPFAQSGGNGMGQVLVCMEGVTVSYGGEPVLEGIDWTVRQGERWALLGPNGAGKTTLLSLILGDNPQAYANRITLFGRRRGTGESIWEIKRQAGWMAPELHLYYPRGVTCLDVVCSGFFDSVGLYQRCSAEQRRAALSWMERLEVAGLASKAFHAVSEGQQRLALVARAVVKEPVLLVLDEPCQGLDATYRDRVLQTVDIIGERLGTGIIYVTHDPLALPAIIDHVLRLEGGRIVSRGRAQQAAPMRPVEW